MIFFSKKKKENSSLGNPICITKLAVWICKLPVHYTFSSDHSITERNSMADKPSRSVVVYGDGLARFVDSSHTHLHSLTSLSSCGFLSLSNSPPSGSPFLPLTLTTTHLLINFLNFTLIFIVFRKRRWKNSQRIRHPPWCMPNSFQSGNITFISKLTFFIFIFYDYLWLMILFLVITIRILLAKMIQQNKPYQIGIFFEAIHFECKKFYTINKLQSQWIVCMTLEVFTMKVVNDMMVTIEWQCNFFYTYGVYAVVVKLLFYTINQLEKIIL